MTCGEFSGRVYNSRESRVARGQSRKPEDDIFDYKHEAERGKLEGERGYGLSEPAPGDRLPPVSL